MLQSALAGSIVAFLGLSGLSYASVAGESISGEWYEMNWFGALYTTRPLTANEKSVRESYLRMYPDEAGHHELHASASVSDAPEVVLRATAPPSGVRLADQGVAVASVIFMSPVQADRFHEGLPCEVGIAERRRAAAVSVEEVVLDAPEGGGQFTVTFVECALSDLGRCLGGVTLSRPGHRHCATGA